MPNSSVAERFWPKVDQSGECWLWTAYINPGGYGAFRYKGQVVHAHRVAYELTFGPIPEGLHIDHVRTRGCTHRHYVNPSHLEAVTPRENTHRGDSPSARCGRATHCEKCGHELEWAKTQRRCVPCWREYHARYYQEHKDAQLV